MNNPIRSKKFENRVSTDSSALILQLEREIMCLNRQLNRLRVLDGYLDRRTEETYRDMINVRQEMLNELE